MRIVVERCLQTSLCSVVVQIRATALPNVEPNSFLRTNRSRLKIYVSIFYFSFDVHMHADAVQLQMDSTVDYTFNGATV